MKTFDNMAKTENDLQNSGYKAWLGFPLLSRPVRDRYSNMFGSICAHPSTLQLEVPKHELKNALKHLLGKTPRITSRPANNSILLYFIEDTPDLGTRFIPEEENIELEDEGYLIKHCADGEKRFLLIAAKTVAGLLYGVFSFVRMLQCGTFSENTRILENPAISIRMLNQWDNMDGSVERGYAGRSIFYENGKFTRNLTRIRDYARLMASIGLNGIVLNNVNVHRTETRLITKEFLPHMARTADIFRHYGIKTYLSINFSSPIEIGGLDTADPLDKRVQDWWKKRAAEIYSYIPDFGGFLVKADSEFRPGPLTYGRNHAEGANMLAAALKPYGGLVIWRCFVYNCMQDWRDTTTDRANAAYDNFMPLDGAFADNVLLQVKNGPMDFQVREPVTPLFGGLKKSNIMLEFQITQEYTGQQKHLCYLAPMWKDVLDFDTYCDGEGSTVKKLLSCGKNGGRLSGIAAVSNIGSDMNWTGHDLAQANLYCFGRLAWQPDLSAADIAFEWTRQTFGSDPLVEKTVCGMLLDSYHIYESYTSPLGIGWMVNPGHHYGPNVDGYEYSPWGTYHRADCKAIGVDRSVATGTGYAGRYHRPNAEMFEKPETCPEQLLLFFHRVPYTYRLKSGVTLIQHIYDSHFEGAEQARKLVDRWKALENRINRHCYERVLARLQEQAAHSCEWRDVINSYFYRKSGIPDEKGRKIY